MKMCNGLSFSEQIKWRVRGLWLLLLVMLAYMIVIGELGLGDSRMMTDLAEQVSRIIFFGGMIWVVCRIVRNRKLLRESWRMKQEMVKERDERRQRLHEKSGGFVWDAMFVCLLAATLTASLIDMPAFYTSFALLTAAVLLKLTTLLFFRARL